ncbi:alkaline phosphatase D family protein [Streptomyces sp. NPDC048411]|uniref:alkaline phosphatase D family protein n=1 Tax=Streptomyces sp. NPDC048411 TaxID=3157206 RepID=UPI0034526A81
MPTHEHVSFSRLLGRRSLLAAGTAGAAVVGGLTAPRAYAASSSGLVLSGRPEVSHGVQVGDVVGRSAVVWARADRTAQMVVEVARDPRFHDAQRVRGPVVTPDSDFTGHVKISGLAAGERHWYRVSFQDPADARRTGAAVTGSFRAAPDQHGPRRDIRFVWSGDMVGQGWGINPGLGGIEIFETMRQAKPDFFLHSGDTIYADGPLQETVTLPDGRVWHNLVTEEKSKVAETLAEYRGNFRYNLLDDNVRAFAAEVPGIYQWDDHEVRNNWYPGQILTDTRYTEKRVDVLAARARRAFFEYLPIDDQSADEVGRIYRRISYGPLLDVFVLDMRTYRDANSPQLNTEPNGGILGRRQTEWLKRGLASSKALWKVVAADMPVGLVVPDGANIEGVANGDPGGPKGRELEIAEVLRHLQRHAVRNTVWVTADVHYAAAHHYDPARAVFQDFDPFWEFVAGPLNAGTTTHPYKLDATFGPQLAFAKNPSALASPLDGYQFFGQVDIDAASGALTVALRDAAGATLWSTRLEAQRSRRRVGL